MNRLVVPSLLAIAVVAFACAPQSRSADADRKQPVDGRPVGAHLDVRVQGGIQLAFRVTNNEPRKVELLFPHGQTHDFIVLDSIGREIWRWSEGRMFTQVVQNRLVDSGASLNWETPVRTDLPPGRYTAVAQLLSGNRPLEERADFVIP